MTTDYSATAWAYARDVVAGQVPAGKWTRKACSRSLADLERQSTSDFPFRFDPAKATKVCRFIELLPHVKGPKGGTKIKLEPWQCWKLAQVFGWVHDGGDRDGMRRFRSSYLEVPRGNAKSTDSSGVGLYMLAADGEYGAEVTASATTAAQARLVFGDAQAMARSPVCAKLMQTVGVQVNAHTITVAAKNSKFFCTSAEYGSLDGLNIHCAILDECHAYADRGLYDVIVTGAGKRPQSLIWMITTAGSDRAGICYEQRSYITKILDGVFQDETTFGCIWHADEEDDWQDEVTWKKANPNWGVSVEPSYVASLATKAKAMPAAQANFRTKHLNRWVSSDHAWMDMLAWDRCRDETLDLSDFTSDPCFIGLDLASKTDVAAKVRLFVRTIDGKQHFFAFGEYYLPEAATRDGRNSQYPGWQTTGKLTATPGDVIDFDLIEADIMDDAAAFNVEEIAYDPWQATQLATHLMENGASMVEYRPTVANFSAPMKELEALVKSGRFHHNDPVLTWMVSNVVCHTDNKDNIFPRKERPENKIDGCVALLMALGRAMAHQPSSGELLLFI